MRHRRSPRCRLPTRTNYALREAALALRGPAQQRPDRRADARRQPGSGVASSSSRRCSTWRAGAPGLGGRADRPAATAGRALAQRLGVQRDPHRRARHPGRRRAARRLGEFVNTWSVDGFVERGLPAGRTRLGHPRDAPFPPTARATLRGCARGHLPAPARRQRPGCAPGRRWPDPSTGFLITHGESISIADYLTVGDPPVAALSADRPLRLPPLRRRRAVGARTRRRATGGCRPEKRVLKDDIDAGADELGVLLMGHARGAYWYGSHADDRDVPVRSCPHNNATSLQVNAAVMGGVIWAMQNPRRDVIEPDELPLRRDAGAVPALSGRAGGRLQRLDAAAGARRACTTKTSIATIHGNSRIRCHDEPARTQASRASR